MVNKAKEYNYNPLKELVTLYVFLKDLEVKYKNRVKRALFLVSDEEKISKEIKEFSKGNFKIQLYNLQQRSYLKKSKYYLKHYWKQARK